MIKLSDYPSVRLKKDDVAPSIEMATLQTNAWDIPEIGAREFPGSGSKFENENTLFARITPYNANESRTLTKTRDLVLPKFKSGGIRLRDAEKVVEEAMT